jgi:hypothetical protein
MAERVTTGERIGYSPEVGWEQWADGSQYRLLRGHDFEQHARAARRAFLSWASRWGFATHSSASSDGQTLVIETYPRGRAFPKRPAVPIDLVAQVLGVSVEEAETIFPVGAGRYRAYRAGGLDGITFVPRDALDRYLKTHDIEPKIDLDEEPREPEVPEQRADEPCEVGK